jgi:hypothetical protein
MDRRKFLKVSAMTTAAIALGGGATCVMTGDSDILDDHSLMEPKKPFQLVLAAIVERDS